MKTLQRYFLFLSLFIILSSRLSALNYYWVGGSGNWSDLSHWATTSGGSTLHTQIPTALDDVFFDANSFSAANQFVTLDPLTILVHDINWTGVTNNPTLDGPGNNLFKIYGSVTFVAGMNMSFGGNINFEATTAGKTIRMNGKSFNQDVVFNGIGGAWTLLDAFSAWRIILNNGVLLTNNQVVNASMFSSTSSTTRTLNMGSSVFNLSSITTPWRVANNGITINCGTSVINCVEDYFEGGDLTYYDLNFTNIDIAAAGTISGNNHFHDVVFRSKAYVLHSNSFHDLTMYGDGELDENNIFNDLDLTAGHTYSLKDNITQTINGTLNATGNCGALIEINSLTSGSQATITHPAGTVNVSYVILKDINATGGATFTASSSIDLGNNTGWTFTSPASNNLYWIGNSGNWDDGSHWSFTSSGAPSGCSPTPMDNVFFDANSFSAAGQTVTLNPFTAYCKDMVWTGVTNSPTLTGIATNLLKIYGSLRFVSNMTQNFQGSVNFEATTTGKTISMAGRSFYDIARFNGIGGGWTLQDEFTTGDILALNAGTLTTNDQTVNAADFISISSFSRTLNMGASIFNISATGTCWNVSAVAMTLNCGTSVINCSSTAAPNFDGGDLTYYDLNFTGIGSFGNIIGNNIIHDVVFISKAYIFQSNTFHDVIIYEDGEIQADNTYHDLTIKGAHTYVLYNGTTQTINGTLNANGNCGALIEINSVTAGSQAIISHPPGTVNVSYVILKDINATGGAGFIANNSIDLGNNTGWTINSPAPKNLYWIGNGGNWDDGNHWSLSSGGAPSGCSPTPLDNVFFDVNSFSVAAQSVTINVSTAYCNNMSWATVTNIPTFAGPFSNNNTLKIYGSLVFDPGMDISFNGPVSFEATTAGKTISMQGRSLQGQVIFNGVGGEWLLQDAFASLNRITLNNGTLTSNNQTVNALEFYSLSTTARILNMGSSVFNLTGVSLNWTVSNAAMTLNSGTSIINFTSGIFSGGNLNYYDLNFNDASISLQGVIDDGNTFHDVYFASNATIGESNTFHDVTILGDGTIWATNVYNDLNFTAGHTYILGAGTDQQINDRLFIQGSCVSYIVLETNNTGSFATITKNSGSVLGYNIHIKDIHCTGGANFIAYNSVDLGGNAGWDFQTLPPLLSPEIISGPTPICAGATAVEYHISPVQGAIYYQWAVPAGATITSGQGDTLIVVDFGTALSGNVTVQSFNGCNYGTFSSTSAVVLATSITPQVTLIAAPGNAICAGTMLSFTATVVNTGGSSVNYDFKINGNSVQSGPSNIYSTTSLLNNDAVTCEISISAGSCYTSATATSNLILMNVGSGPSSVHVNAGNDITIAAGQTIQLQASGDQGIYTWSPATGLNATDILAPVASPTVTTSYTLTITNLQGCTGSDNVKVTVVTDCAGKPMNAITPNGDGINDRWIVSTSSCVISSHVKVFNRYGSPVFESNNYQDDWEGTYKGKTLPDGTYYYVVEYRLANGKVVVLRGDVTILR